MFGRKPGECFFLAHMTWPWVALAVELHPRIKAEASEEKDSVRSLGCTGSIRRGVPLHSKLDPD